MRHHYRNLFGSCLLAALILPTQHGVAAPLQEVSGGLRTDWSAAARTGTDTLPTGTASPGIQSPGIQNPGMQSPGMQSPGISAGLREEITASAVTGAGREPILGRAPTPPKAPPVAIGLPRPPAAPDAAVLARSGAAVLASAAEAAPISDAPTLAPPGSTSSSASPVTGSGGTETGSLGPVPGFASPRPVMPQALSDALAALAQKKADDAIRLARTFISQTEARGPGPDNTPAALALAHEIVGTGLAVQGKQADAIAELQKALSLNPNQSSALFKLGVIYREENKLPEAKAALEKAAALGGGDPVKLYLGDVSERTGDIPAAIKYYEQLMTGARASDEKFRVHLAALYDRVNRFPDAIKLLEPSVTVASKDPEALMALGFAYGGSGKPKQAIPLLVAAKALTPDNWRIDLALGTAQREVGEFDAAEASLRRVIAAEPKQVQARFQLALVQMGKAQFAEAVGTLDDAVKLAPNAVEIQQVRGDALFRAGKKDEAIAQFKALATRDGAAINDSVNLARAYQASGRMDDAVQTYRDTLQKFPPNPAVYAMLAGTLAQQKKYADARETIATARKLTPDDPRLLRSLIEIDSTAGDFKTALPIAQHLVDLQPKSLEDRYALAVLYGRLGDRKKAINTYRAILADAPNNPVVLNNLASVMTDDGDAAGALPMAKHAQELQPKSSAINDTLGWALLKTGQTKEALPLFETATQIEPNNAELLYHLAMAQKATNNPKAARVNLEKALAMSQDFSGVADAKAALASLPK